MRSLLLTLLPFLATGWTPAPSLPLRLGHASSFADTSRACVPRAAEDNPHPEAPAEGLPEDSDEMQKALDSMQLNKFNDELYGHLGKRPEYETSELYSSLRKRMDVDDPLYSELSARRAKLESEPEALPSPDQTPGEVIELVLRALRDVDWPEPFNGIKVLRTFSGKGSVLETGQEEVSAQMLVEYFEQSKYGILLEWVSIQYLKKLELSLDRKRALQQIRLTSGAGSSVAVTFQLSKYQRPEGEVWLIDQLLVKT